MTVAYFSTHRTQAALHDKVVVTGIAEWRDPMLASHPAPSCSPCSSVSLIHGQKQVVQTSAAFRPLDKAMGADVDVIDARVSVRHS